MAKTVEASRSKGQPPWVRWATYSSRKCCSEEDLDKLLDICDNILGRSFCALGDGATSPITSSIQYFRDEYIAHLTHGGCPFDPKASTLFAKDDKDSVPA